MSRLLYLDTSAALKRVLVEQESTALRDEITAAIARGDRFVTSALSIAELARSLRRLVEDEPLPVLRQAESEAIGDLAIAPIGDLVVDRARIIGPSVLRALDAIHLATAVAVAAAEVWTYDDRLAEAAGGLGIPARMPGRDAP